MRTVHTTIRVLPLIAAALIAGTARSSFAQSLSDENFAAIARVIGPSQRQRLKLNAFVTFKGIRDTMAAAPSTPSIQFEKWHEITLAALAADHIPELDQNGVKKTLQQFGPHRASYVTAMVHLAVFEVANAYRPRYASWIATNLGTSAARPALEPPAGSAEDAAIEAAAHTMLAALYKNFGPELDGALTYQKCDGTSPSIRDGCSFGRQVAALIIGLRANDKSTLPEPTFGLDFVPKLGTRDDGGNYPDGQWTPDPVSKLPVVLGGNWGIVASFFPDLDAAGKQLDLPGPPKPDDPEYKAALDEVRVDGEDRERHPGLPPATRDQAYHKYVGKFWSYDGTPSLCAPVRLYNQIAASVLTKYPEIAPDVDEATHVVEIAQYYALLNLAMVDAGIKAWKYKYHFQYWRPVTGVRAAMAPPPPPDPIDAFHKQRFAGSWYPLGAQNTNSAAGFNTTPPFPAYPSGHAVFGSAMFEVLRHFVPNDKGFEMTSDELNPELGNVDAYNFRRCVDADKNPFFCNKPVPFASFAEAEACNSKSRIWLGVHWSFDATAGERLGRGIGKAAWRQLRPLGAAPPGDDPDTPIATCSTPASFQLDFN